MIRAFLTGCGLLLDAAVLAWDCLPRLDGRTPEDRQRDREQKRLLDSFRRGRGQW